MACNELIWPTIQIHHVYSTLKRFSMLFKHGIHVVCLQGNLRRDIRIRICCFNNVIDIFLVSQIEHKILVQFLSSNVIVGCFVFTKVQATKSLSLSYTAMVFQVNSANIAGDYFRAAAASQSVKKLNTLSLAIGTATNVTIAIYFALTIGY